MNPKSLLLAFALLSACPASATQASLVVSYYDVGILLHGSSFHEGAAFVQSDNPFQGSHSLTIANSTVTTSYNFSWDEQASTGTFQIDFIHSSVANSDQPATNSAGFIYFTSDEDLLIHMEGTFNYYILGPYMHASVGGGVTSNQTQYFVDTALVDDFFDPPTGTMTINDQGVIPAGCLCSMGYSADASTSVSSGATYGGQGSIHFTVQPVPEPSSLGLVLALFCAMRRFTPARGPRAARLRSLPSSRC